MRDLNNYILEVLPIQDSVISELYSAIDKTINLFEIIPFDSERNCWGYGIGETSARNSNTGTLVPGGLSQSTASMISAALLRSVHGVPLNASSGFPGEFFRGGKRPKVKEQIERRISESIDVLQKKWVKNFEDRKIYTNSTTYGNDDILSLSWHYDIFRAGLFCEQSLAESVVRQCQEVLLKRASEYNDAATSYSAIRRAFRNSNTPESEDARVGDSSYILLRFVRCLISLPKEVRSQDDGVRGALTRASKRFASKLHDHLSLAEITDSRFDPAELAFCLEGLLHTKPEQVGYPLLDRAIAVLTKAQSQSAYWRSETPIVIQQRGHVLFPIGVEVARSILNSIAIYIKQNNNIAVPKEIQYDHLLLIGRYWAWLKTRHITIEKSEVLIHGWHSEHINDPGLIHTWETSQILEFMISFHSLLQYFVASELLLLSRLDVRQPDKQRTWDDIVNDYEPCQSSPYNVYAQIGRDFVIGRTKDESLPLSWSMLLYGPPGTGKSTVAENLSDCLQMPVVTVTVSDFLGEGESRMESRVKNIFTVIERQSGSIILFDEMDQFLLDRNSPLFRQQSSVFQFLTPGMLTKFAKLRKSASVIFIIATNFEERIDPAIKRTGRIDQSYLVLPPDNTRREENLRHFLPSIMDLAVQEDKRSEILEASCLLGYADLKQVSSNIIDTPVELINLLSLARRNISFTALSERYESGKSSRGLLDEIAGIIRLIDDAHRKPLNMKGNWEGYVEFNKLINALGDGDPLKKLYQRLVEEKTENLGARQ